MFSITDVYARQHGNIYVIIMLEKNNIFRMHESSDSKLAHLVILRLKSNM